MPGAKVVSSSLTRRQPATVALVGPLPPACRRPGLLHQSTGGQGFKAVPGEAWAPWPPRTSSGRQRDVNIAVMETAGVSTFTIGANVAAESVK